MTFMKPTAGNLDGVPPAALLDAELQRARGVLHGARAKAMIHATAFGVADRDLRHRHADAIRRVRYLEGLADA